MNQPPDVSIAYLDAPDGTRLGYRELGAGEPVVLIHGFISTGYVNWIRYGHAQRLADQGRRVIMPDLRAHGASGKPHDPAAYPPDVLTDDALALLTHLGLGDGGYDLGGYSLGARTVVRLLARGARPRRALVAGMGLEGMTEPDYNSAFFRRVLSGYGTFKHGDPEFMSQAFLKTVGGDPEALTRLLDTNVATPLTGITAITTPTRVVMGDLDDDHGDGLALAETLPQGSYATVPGGHMGAVAQSALGEAIAAFFGDGR